MIETDPGREAVTKRVGDGIAAQAQSDNRVPALAMKSTRIQLLPE
jgi:hypothetical protein